MLRGVRIFPNKNVLIMEIWLLDVIWNLGFGAWDFLLA